jgi:nucleoid-associated protein YgaU
LAQKATATPSAQPTITPTATPKPISTPVAQGMTKGGLPIGAPTTETPKAPTQQPTTSLPVDGKYTVQRGDSSWKLAQRFLGNGYRYVEIEKANNLKHNQYLEVGQVLSISKTAATASEKVSTPGAPAEQQVTQSANSGKSYTVKAGDTLWGIAQAQLGSNYRWSEVYKLNRQVVGANPGLIYPGQTLVLPTTTSQSSGSIVPSTPNPGK